MYYGNMVCCNLITISEKIMHWSKFYQGKFSSQWYLRKRMVNSVGENIHTMLSHCIQLQSHFLQILRVGQNFIKGHFCLIIHQEIAWWTT
jgi:hypothetical protein